MRFSAIRFSVGPSLLLLLVVVLSSCAVNQYRGGSDHGYKDRQMDENTWEVTYNGNYEMPRRTIRDYAYRRAAEITLAAGFTHFVVLESDVDSNDAATYRPNPYYGGGGSVRARSKYTVTIVVRGARAGTEKAFDAQYLLKTLTP